jgi:hypothetical protein
LNVFLADEARRPGRVLLQQRALRLDAHLADLHGLALERHVQLGREVRCDLHLLRDERREADQVRVHDVRARRNPDDEVVALLVGDGAESLALDAHVDTRHRLLLVVDDATGQLARRPRPCE